MCGRYALSQPNDIFDRFDIEFAALNLRPNYNTAPTMDMPVITTDHKLTIMKWGFIPFWEKDPIPQNQLINARAETVAEKASFKKALLTNRCIIPADGFYEWQKTPQGKLPYFIHRKDKQLFGFAGIYDTWRNAQGQSILTYLIITTTPNNTMSTIHNRMPAILLPEQEETWLNPDITEQEHLLSLLNPYPDELMEAYQVSTAVNGVRENSEELIKRVS